MLVRKKLSLVLTFQIDSLPVRLAGRLFHNTEKKRKGVDRYVRCTLGTGNVVPQLTPHHRNMARSASTISSGNPSDVATAYFLFAIVERMFLLKTKYHNNHRINI